ncbi:MAG TPA: type II secretion system F family protein [Gaiellaceae bacterium]
MILLILGFLLCGLAVVLVLDAALKPRAERRASLRRVRAYAAMGAVPRRRRGHQVGVVDALVPALSRIALRVTPRAHVEELQSRLAAAGIRGRINAQQFLALKTVLAFLGLVLGVLAGGLGLRGLVLVVLFVGASLVLPDFVIARAGQARAERLTADLPQAIDQIVVSLEAGLGFDAAVSYFVQRSKLPLAGELRLMLSEIRMGEARTEALKRLAERVPSNEMRTFAHTLIQSEGAGISRVAILRSQASDLRHRRQLAAEEKAQKAPIKMLFPTVVFILPVMFVVILGPALQQVSDLFNP